MNIHNITLYSYYLPGIVVAKGDSLISHFLLFLSLFWNATVPKYTEAWVIYPVNLA